MSLWMKRWNLHVHACICYLFLHLWNKIHSLVSLAGNIILHNNRLSLSLSLKFLWPAHFYPPPFFLFNSLSPFLATGAQWLFYFICSAITDWCCTSSSLCFIFFLARVSFLRVRQWHTVRDEARQEKEREREEREERTRNMLSTRVKFIQIDWSAEEAGTHRHTPEIESG